MKKIRLSQFLKLPLYIGLIYILITFFIMPLMELFKETFIINKILSLDNFTKIFNNPNSITAIINTILLGILTVIICGFIGTILAFFTSYYKVFSKLGEKIIKVIALMPFLIPGVIIVLSSLQLFGSLGIFPQFFKAVFHLSKVPFALKGLWGVLFIHGITQYIYFYINVSIALKSLDSYKIDAAKNLGATNNMILKDVIFPHIKPALLSSALLTLFSAISSFSAPSLLEGNFRVISTEIMNYKQNNLMAIASSYVVMLFIASLIFVLIYKYYDKSTMDLYKGRQSRGRRVEIKGLNRILSKMVVIIISFLIILPIIAVIYMSFIKTSSWMNDIFPNKFTLNNYIKVFNSNRILSPLFNSIKMSFVASIITLIIATIGAYLTLGKQSIIKKILGGLFLLPMALPASTLGVILITGFNEPNPLIFNKVLLGTIYLLPLAYIILSITPVFNTLRNSFINFRRETFEASELLGASKLKSFFKVFLPEVKNGILYGFTLVFLRSLGEYTASAFLYGPKNKPISIAMVNALQDYNIGVSMVFGTILIITGIVFITVLDNKNIL